MFTVKLGRQHLQFPFRKSRQGRGDVWLAPLSLSPRSCPVLKDLDLNIYLNKKMPDNGSEYFFVKKKSEDFALWTWKFAFEIRKRPSWWCVGIPVWWFWWISFRHSLETGNDSQSEICMLLTWLNTLIRHHYVCFRKCHPTKIVQCLHMAISCNTSYQYLVSWTMDPFEAPLSPVLALHSFLGLVIEEAQVVLKSRSSLSCAHCSCNRLPENDVSQHWCRLAQWCQVAFSSSESSTSWPSTTEPPAPMAWDGVDGDDKWSWGVAVVSTVRACFQDLLVLFMT